MRLLITGHRGFIGGHLMNLFPDARGYDIKDGNDILDKENLLAHLEGTDVVVHLAALISVEESKREPTKYLNNNVLGTMSVLECAIKCGVKKIIYASSAACYDTSSSPYAISKYASELLMLTYKNLIHTTSLRFFNIYGEGQNSAYGAVITSFREGMERGEINIYGDGEQTRDFISVKDVCNAIKLSIDSNIPSGEVIDIGTGSETSVIKLASIMSGILEKSPKVNFLPERDGVRYSVANLEKAKTFIDFKAQVQLEDGC